MSLVANFLTAKPQNRNMLQTSLTGNLGPLSGSDRAIPISVIPYLSNKIWPEMKKKIHKKSNLFSTTVTLQCYEPSIKPICLNY